jgi:hypothetical protein
VSDPDSVGATGATLIARWYGSHERRWHDRASLDTIAGRTIGTDMAPRLDVVGLVIKDMAASLAFYPRFGLTFAEGAEAEGHVEAASYEIHLEPRDAFWGQRYASVHDPDGNAVELFASLPG